MKEKRSERMTEMIRDKDGAFILLDNFIQATRDSGYKGTTTAVSELVDNALQAGATRISISLIDTGEDLRHPLVLAVLDNGCGMNAPTLRQALRFGGSSRFGDRTGLGRYGMGLPNSSLSQSRCLDVYSWQKRGEVISTYFDFDEIVSGHLTEVPEPEPRQLPPYFEKNMSKSGTLVIWSRCDRLDNKRPSTIMRKLSVFLGRAFRYYLWDGVEIYLNGAKVRPIDPLFLAPDSLTTGARLYSEPIVYEVEASTGNGKFPEIGMIEVTFSELPIDNYHSLPNKEKRRLGITNAAGVSVVRSRREIDYGWYFMGSKRRENYDDWWRCEVRFDPVLDEDFGITHTKQQIRPAQHLLDILSPDIEVQARALNNRARRTHFEIKTRTQFAESEKRATDRDKMLKPVARQKLSVADQKMLKELMLRHPILKDMIPNKSTSSLQYIIVEDDVNHSCFYSTYIHEGKLILALNPHHPFYKKLYKPLSESDQVLAQRTRAQLELLLLAAARSEAATSSKKEKALLSKYRTDWSHVLANFFKD